MVLNTASVGPHETFPITVPTNVTISGATPGSPTTVDLPANKTAFALASASSGLSNLLIDGAKQTGTTGVTVNTGSAASTSISGVTIQNMTGDGIDVVNSGVVTLGPGTVSENNGTDKIQSAGIQISGGQAIITVDNGSPAKFSGNSGPGIFVSAGGSVTIGTDQASLSPAAISESNIEAGLFILQTPGATVPQNTVYNLQALNSVTGNGIIIFGGSTLELRKSQMGGNLESGILVETYTNGAAKSDDVSKIDLGTSSSAGGNTFQYADGGTFKPNGGAGICLDLSSNAGQTLSAQGDIFGTDDCATTASALTMSISCSGGVDIAILRSGSTDAINASLCTQ
jgi:hypothetical protein